MWELPSWMSARGSGKRLWLEETIRVRLSVALLLFVKELSCSLYLELLYSLCSLPKGSIRGDAKGQVALLSRTNANVFDEAVRVTDGEIPARIHLIGVRVSYC